MDAGRIPPTLPFHIARAYGVNQSTSLRARPQGLDRLVAGKVAVPASPANVPASFEEGAFPMYRNPAEKNAAATGVMLGRKLDLNA